MSDRQIRPAIAASGPLDYFASPRQDIAGAMIRPAPSCRSRFLSELVQYWSHRIPVRWPRVWCSSHYSMWWVPPRASEVGQGGVGRTALVSLI